MGAVYEAEQDNPKRTVALKVIKAGLASGELLQRFRHEAHVLGRLQHPGIAQIHEAGTFETDSGLQPYFAMERIQGDELDIYCQRHELGTRQRLELIARIADAVQHAHQRGVIHRDLKPGNILVDVHGQPKILDFGIARATDSDIQATMQTDIGQLVGTLPYMSPEQTAGDSDELDTRSDVYSLGVIAYELLTGRLPFDLKRQMIHEAVRTIRESEPKTLSSIDRSLRGDVETIVSKALEKEKERRYQSASDLAADIRRYDNHEPISARPPSASYTLRKFARRNKALVIGAAAVFFVLVAGVVSTTSFALRAQDETEKAQDLASFQKGMLQDLAPKEMSDRLLEDLREQTRQKLEAQGGTADEIESAIDALDQALAPVNLTSVAVGVIEDNIPGAVAGNCGGALQRTAAAENVVSGDDHADHAQPGAGSFRRPGPGVDHRDAPRTLRPGASRNAYFDEQLRHDAGSSRQTFGGSRHPSRSARDPAARAG